MVKAVIFDFDGTLTPEIAPRFEILEKSGMPNGVANPEFTKMMKDLAAREKIDIYEAMIRTILNIVSAAGFELIDQNIGLGANNRTFNRGVEELLRALKDSGVRSYILSSGSKAYLAQTKIAPLFTDIYASTLTYDDNGQVNGIENVMTVQEKAETLRSLAREINGSENDCKEMVYVGDGPTDMDAINFIKAHGGKAILVYNGQPTAETSKMAAEGSTDLFTIADYSKGGEIYNYLLA